MSPPINLVFLTMSVVVCGHTLLFPLKEGGGGVGSDTCCFYVPYLPTNHLSLHLQQKRGKNEGIILYGVVVAVYVCIYGVTYMYIPAC